MLDKFRIILKKIIFLTFFENLFTYLDVILEIEGSVRRRYKGQFFRIKNYERVPLVSATPIFIAYLHCF